MRWFVPLWSFQFSWGDITGCGRTGTKSVEHKRQQMVTRCADRGVLTTCRYMDILIDSVGCQDHSYRRWTRSGTTPPAVKAAFQPPARTADEPERWPEMTELDCYGTADWRATYDQACRLKWWETVIQVDEADIKSWSGTQMIVVWAMGIFLACPWHMFHCGNTACTFQAHKQTKPFPCFVLIESYFHRFTNHLFLRVQFVKTGVKEVIRQYVRRASGIVWNYFHGLNLFDVSCYLVLWLDCLDFRCWYSYMYVQWYCS